MSKRLGTWKLFLFFSYIFWAPHFFHLNHDMNIFPFNPFYSSSQHLRQIFKEKSFSFVLSNDFVVFFATRIFPFPTEQEESTKKIHWTRRSALVIHFFSYLIKPLSFIFLFLAATAIYTEQPSLSHFLCVYWAI